MSLKSPLAPAEAWLSFVPSPTTPFDLRAAAHVLRRAGFSGSRRQLQEMVEKQTLLPQAETEVAQGFEADMHRMALAVLAGNNPESLASWWLYRMRFTPSPLLEKTTLFWHGHFATSAAKVNNAKLLLRQNELLRKYALGSFEALEQGIARDPAMLLYLDSATNRKTHPNENFAREVMELFCLGVGNYSEHDIQELARCFTGWEIQQGEFKFNPFQHDYGTKQLFAQSGNWDGDAAIGVLLEQPAAAEFLCRKLVRYFVADELEMTPELIAPLAQLAREQKYDMGKVVETILTSRLFFHPSLRGAKVRSPVELSIGLLRTFEATANMNGLVGQLRNIGQLPLYPPNVKGWNGGREWLNASTLVGRANLARQLLENNEVQFGGGSLEAYLTDQGIVGTGQEIVAALCELLLPIDPPAEVQSLLATELDRDARREPRLRATLHALCALPEFQLA